jgi:hypothetical protein
MNAALEKQQSDYHRYVGSQIENLPPLRTASEIELVPLKQSEKLACSIKRGYAELHCYYISFICINMPCITTNDQGQAHTAHSRPSRCIYQRRQHKL